MSLSSCPSCGELYPADILTCPRDGEALREWTRVEISDDEDATDLDPIAPRRQTTQAGPPSVGDRLRERYELTEQIGVGGYGVVFAARDNKLERQVAIKILSPELCPSDNAMSRFRQEAVAAGRIHHEGIVVVSDFDVHVDGTAFIVMEYLSGRDLAVELRELGPMEPTRALLLMIQAARALAAAHATGILHRDLKPANIYITSTPDRQERVKIIDFGISKILRGATTAHTSGSLIMGTPIYMAPETARKGKQDARTDIYALSVILYEMLTGKPPFYGDDSMHVLYQHCHAKPEPPSKLVPMDARLDALVLRGLAKSPGARFQSMDKFSRAMLECLESLDPGAMARALVPWRDAQAVAPRSPGRSASAKRRGLLALGAVLGLAAIGWFVWPQSGSPSISTASAPQVARQQDTSSDAMPAAPEAELGKAESATGKAEAELGKAESKTGKAEAELGKAESKTGKAESKTGKAEAELGKAESKTGKAEREKAAAQAQREKEARASERAAEKAAARERALAAEAKRQQDALAAKTKADAELRAQSEQAAHKNLRASATTSGISVQGPLRSSEVTKALAKINPELRKCYGDASARAKSNASVTLSLRFEINETRRAFNSRVSASALSGLSACVEKAIDSIRVSRRPDVGNATISLQVLFAYR